MLLDFLIIYLLKKPSIFDPYGEIKCPPEYHLEQSTKKGTPFLRFPVSCCQAYIRANGIICVQSTQRRYHDSCSEQCGHLAH